MLNTDFLNENLVAPATKFICTYNILFASANKAYLHPQINICTKIRKKWHDKKALDGIVFDALGLTVISNMVALRSRDVLYCIQ